MFRNSLWQPAILIKKWSIFVRLVIGCLSVDFAFFLNIRIIEKTRQSSRMETNAKFIVSLRYEYTLNMNIKSKSSTKNVTEKLPQFLWRFYVRMLSHLTVGYELIKTKSASLCHLFVGEDEKNCFPELVLGQHSHQLVASFADTFAIVGVDHENEA